MFQGDVMVLTVVNEMSFYREVRFLSARIRSSSAFSAESFAAFAVRDVYREERKGRKAMLPLIRISRDQQSSEHWRHHRSAAYNPG
jgi:hypothetical protein